jgi:hypothetical protein
MRLLIPSPDALLTKARTDSRIAREARMESLTICFMFGLIGIELGIKGVVRLLQFTAYFPTVASCKAAGFSLIDSRNCRSDS